MYNLSPMNEEDVATFFLSDPKLALLGLPDEELHLLRTEQKFKLEGSCQAEGVYEDGELIGVLMWNMFTNMVINMHLYLSSHFHGSGKFKDVHGSIISWAKETPFLKRIVVFSPSTCIHIHKAMEGVGFELEGIMPSAIEWRQEVVDLFIFGRKV